MALNTVLKFLLKSKRRVAMVYLTIATFLLNLCSCMYDITRPMPCWNGYSLWILLTEKYFKMNIKKYFEIKAIISGTLLLIVGFCLFVLSAHKNISYVLLTAGLFHYVFLIYSYQKKAKKIE